MMLDLRKIVNILLKKEKFNFSFLLLLERGIIILVKIMSERQRKHDMKKKIKKFSTYEFSTIDYVKRNYIENGVAVIKLSNVTWEDFIDPYSVKQPLLKQDMADYIKRVTYNIPTSYAVEIQIEDRGYSEEEKRQIRKLIIDYFGLEVGDKIVDLNFNTVKALILLLVGIFFLGLFLLFSYYEQNNIIIEVMSITGWFAIWEFVNAIWFERSKLQLGRMNAGQLATANITFVHPV